MSGYFARVIRALIVSLFGFGGGVGLMVFIATLVIKGDQHAFQYGLIAGIAIGVVFSILLLGVLLPLDLTAHLFLSKGKYKEIWELEQSREVNYSGSLKDLTSSCREALLAVPLVKSISENPEHQTMTALTGPSWRSGGEEIEVQLNPEAENKWKVHCQSRSNSRSVVFDYGKNFENVEAWQATFIQLMKDREKNHQAFG